MSIKEHKVKTLNKNDLKMSFSIEDIKRLRVKNPSFEIVGQPRALLSIKLSLAVNKKNLFIMGEKGCGRKTSVYQLSKDLAFSPQTLYLNKTNNHYYISLEKDDSSIYLLTNDKFNVIEDRFPQQGQLFGIYDGKNIVCGSFLEAAGGVLILNAGDMLRDLKLWNSVKRTILTGYYPFYNSDDKIVLSVHAGSFLPKIFMVGTEDEYNSFIEKDSEFINIFGDFAEFDYTMELNDENIKSTISYLLYYQEKNNLLSLSDESLFQLIKYSCFYCESRFELTTELSVLSSVLEEANYWAKENNHDCILGTDILETLDKKEYILGIEQSKIQKEIISKEVLIRLSGTEVGRVNGLAVIDKGSFSFGFPTVITVTVAPGSEGIVNIEHEVGLSGEIHDKGVLILEGYLRNTYAQTFPLSLYSGICFEQSYAEVDGDSASTSELFALLSAIGNIPIKQNISVTGSVNQMGEIQPVGGINEKIEGFYSLVKAIEPNKKHGVIIPEQNINNLILSDKIMESIKNKEFFVYPIKTVNQGLEILTDRTSGVRNNKNVFEANTINRAIEDNLKSLCEKSRRN